MKTPKITFHIEAEVDDISIRGNAMVSGDDALDKQVEDEILARLDSGDVWAWACVKVVASCEGFEGCDYLGDCSYKDEDDFRENSGHYEDMCHAATLDLIGKLRAKVAEGNDAADLLKALGEGGEG